MLKCRHTAGIHTCSMTAAKRARGDTLAILKHFAEAQKSVYTPKNLKDILAAHGNTWKIPESYGVDGFIELLESRVGLRVASFKSGTRQEHRLFRGSPTDFEIAASFLENGYFSHQTAAILHSLLQFAPTRFFINNEQSPKPRSTNLNQEAIRLAFSRRPRHSQLIFRQTQLSNGCEYVMLSGKYSGNAGVTEIDHPVAGKLRVTNLARTLIDAVVRPQYVGDSNSLLTIFRAAKTTVGAEEIMKMLASLDYIYPYQQAIGFLMQRAGFPKIEYEKLKNLTTSFDFYLHYQMVDPVYDSGWKLYYPRDIN
jgi:predicted transcriptional regulator of viral defense system